MKYKDFSVEDFAADPYFRQWVQQPNPESEIFWQTWLHQHPEKKEMIEKARHIVLFLNFEQEHLSEKDAKSIWKNVEVATHTIERHSTLISRSNWYQIAAAFAGLLLVSVLLLWVYRTSDTTHTTAFGEVKTILLPDSSEIVLNANSTLSYPTHWDKSKVREVFLSGEAFFKVQEKPVASGYAKFIVHTRHLDVEVLGTQFNVHHRRNKTQVVLNSGKVRLKSSQVVASVLTMYPGEMVEFSENEKEFIKKTVDTEVYTSWRHHELTFVGTPLSEIAKVLEDTYGLHLKFENTEIGSKEFTGSVPTDSIEMLLHTWEQLFNLKIVREDQQIIIEKR